MDQKLHKKLADRKEKGTLRSLSSFEGMVDFVSNDYLGLAMVDYELTNDFGATGSRLISGNSNQIESAEKELAIFFESPAALCFNSGYDANLGIFGSIPQKGDVVLYDADIHASVRDGLRLSNAENFSFKHNDVNDLERLLRKFAGKTVYVAIEGLYSMGGDLAPIGEITALTNQFGAYLIVDEAHSGGIFGAKGRGVAHALSCIPSCFIRVITFGKAYGAHGAAVLCSQEVKAFLINFSRPFIYTTALPVSSYQKMVRSVTQEDLDARRSALQSNLRLFRANLKADHLISEINSPIQIIRGLDISSLELLQASAKREGIAIKLVYPPTVKNGDESIRMCMHSFNTPTEIERLVRVLEAFDLTH